MNGLTMIFLSQLHLVRCFSTQGSELDACWPGPSYIIVFEWHHPNGKSIYYLDLHKMLGKRKKNISPNLSWYKVKKSS